MPNCLKCRIAWRNRFTERIFSFPARVRWIAGWFIVVPIKGDHIVMIHLTSEETFEPGPDLVINCPVCLQTDVNATSFEVEIKERVYGWIAVNRVRRSHVRCEACQTVLVSSVAVSELEGRPSVDISEYLSHQASFVSKSLAVLAGLLFVLPFVGTAMAVIAITANRKYRSWPRTVSVLALTANIMFWITFEVYLRPMLINMK